MPSDEWRKANNRARFGPQRYTGEKPHRGPKTHLKRVRKPKHTYVSVGTCLVKRATRFAVQVVLPAGNLTWLPRLSVMNGNMNFRRDQVLELRIDLWLAERERIPYVPRSKSNDTSNPTVGPEVP